MRVRRREREKMLLERDSGKERREEEKEGERAREMIGTGGG